jgi:AraC-like DNA-binding protein
MPTPTLLMPMPRGIPTYSSRHGAYVCRPGLLPVFQIHNDWDLFWITQGEATWELKDGRKLVAGKDQFALLPPFVAAMIDETKAQLKFYYCHFNFRLAPTHLMEAAKRNIDGPGEDVLLPLTFDCAKAPGVVRVYRAINRLNSQTITPWLLERSIIDLVSELALFAQQRSEGEGGGTLFNPASQADPRVSAVCKRIDADPVQAWRVTDLADSVGLSAGRLHSLFRRVTGRSLKHYIVRARLERALKLLKERSDGRLPSIKEISGACGFSSQHFFSRQFKAFFRVTPLAYRDGATLV